MTQRAVVDLACSADGVPPHRGGARIGLFGLFGAGNLGNDGSLEAMLRLLRRDLPSAELTAICADPDLIRSTHKVATLPFRVVASDGRWMRGVDRLLLGLPLKLLSWSRALAATRNLDVMIIPGTGILDDYGTGPRGMPYGLFRWCVAARLNGVRIAFVSIGAGPIHHPLSRWLMTQAIARADYRSYRDLPSRAFMQSLGFDTAHDPIRPDIAFSLDPAEERAELPAPSHELTIGLGVMTYRGWSVDAAEGQPIFDRYVDRIALLLSRILERGYRVRLLTGEIGEAGDAITVQRVMDRIKPSLPPALIEKIMWQEPQSLEDVIALAGDTDIVVASRFHNIVAALIAGKPAISLGYAAKNVALLESVGLGSFCHDIDDIPVDTVLAQIATLANERRHHEAVIRSAVASCRLELDAQQIWLVENIVRASERPPALHGTVGISRPT